MQILHATRLMLEFLCAAAPLNQYRKNQHPLPPFAPAGAKPALTGHSSLLLTHDQATWPQRDHPSMLAPFHSPVWLRPVARCAIQLTPHLSGLPSALQEL